MLNDVLNNTLLIQRPPALCWEETRQWQVGTCEYPRVAGRLPLTAGEDASMSWNSILSYHIGKRLTGFGAVKSPWACLKGK